MESSTGSKLTSLCAKLTLGSGFRVRQIPNRHCFGPTSVPHLRMNHPPPFSRSFITPRTTDRHSTSTDGVQSPNPQEPGPVELEEFIGNLRGDLFGGFTAAIVALPLALAFGVASGAGPLAGLYGAVFSGFFAALFGGTPAQVTGPTGPMTVVAATVFAQYASDHSLAFSVICLAGIFQIIMGAMKLGRFIKLVPAPVISGFMSGIGCIILSTQLLPLCGLHAAPSALAAVQAIPGLSTQINVHAFFIGILSFALCTFTPKRIARLIPGSLIALITGTAISIFYGLNVPILGQIPSQMPSPLALKFPLIQLPVMLKSGIVLSLLGTIDSLLTSLVADNLTDTYHDSNQEMIGQGIGNTVSGVFGGIPGAGATMRTVVNIRAGGRSRLSGMFHSFLLFCIVLGAGPIAQSIPQSVLAGILMKTGLDIIDKRFILRLRKLPPATGIVMWTVLLMTVFIDLIAAVGTGCVLASLLLVNKLSTSEVHQCSIITTADLDQLQDSSPSTLDLTDDEAQLIRSTSGQLGLIKMKGSFTFGAANGILRKILSAGSSLQGLVMDLSLIGLMDGDAILVLERLQQKLRKSKKLFLISGASVEVQKMLEKVGMDLPLPSTTDRTQCLYFAVKEIMNPPSSPGSVPSDAADYNNSVKLSSTNSFNWNQTESSFSVSLPKAKTNSEDDDDDDIVKEA